MKTASVFALTILFVSAHVSRAHGECYGEAAAAYGCGAPAGQAKNTVTRSASGLERFGSTEGQVLPDTGNSNNDSSDVISPEERYQMMRRIVLGRGTSSQSTAALNRAVSSASRPLRASGSMPARTR
jgi:hypothetical protein